MNALSNRSNAIIRLLVALTSDMCLEEFVATPWNYRSNPQPADDYPMPHLEDDHLIESVTDPRPMISIDKKRQSGRVIPHVGFVKYSV